jgi:hypothetical protein
MMIVVVFLANPEAGMSDWKYLKEEDFKCHNPPRTSKSPFNISFRFARWSEGPFIFLQTQIPHWTYTILHPPV